MIDTTEIVEQTDERASDWEQIAQAHGVHRIPVDNGSLLKAARRAAEDFRTLGDWIERLTAERDGLSDALGAIAKGDDLTIREARAIAKGAIDDEQAEKV